ncbi:hypothetical protein ACQFX9_21480 [Aliinostoc sp. HNIBRCY26]|uniref:hypothetical protein n=1 Tax=Aliinostoc sp. HNIBRCY26 TaxID=3418997 RepID=UPI003CFEDF05
MLTPLCLEREGFLRCFSRDYNLRSLLYIRLLAWLTSRYNTCGLIEAYNLNP